GSPAASSASPIQANNFTTGNSPAGPVKGSPPRLFGGHPTRAVIVWRYSIHVEGVMRITVTQEDIEQGRRNEPNACAVARAFLRAGVDHFGLLGARVMVANRVGHLVSLLLPRPVRNWIQDFDAGRLVVPITFDIGMPSEQIRIKGKSNMSRRTALDER